MLMGERRHSAGEPFGNGAFDAQAPRRSDEVEARAAESLLA